MDIAMNSGPLCLEGRLRASVVSFGLDCPETSTYAWIKFTGSRQALYTPSDKLITWPLANAANFVRRDIDVVSFQGVKCRLDQVSSRR
jgi:hypothetical protein